MPERHGAGGDGGTLHQVGVCQRTEPGLQPSRPGATVVVDEGDGPALACQNPGVARRRRAWPGGAHHPHAWILCGQRLGGLHVAGGAGVADADDDLQLFGGRQFLLQH